MSGIPNSNSNPAYLGRSRITHLLRTRDIRPSKSLGQNFLADPNQVRKICALSGAQPGDRVLEIGPGLGSLTVGLLALGAEVVAIERDARLAEVLEETAPGAYVVIADALECKISSTARNAAGGKWQAPWRLAANLPYSTATTIFLRILETVPEVTGGIVMLQREVAERLVADPGSRDYGITTVITSYFAEAAIAGRVPRDLFVPRPSVESALLAFERREQPAVGADKELIFDLARAGFAHRRKKLRNALRDLPWGDRALAACEAAGIDSGRRAETLSLEEFGVIAELSDSGSGASREGYAGDCERSGGRGAVSERTRR